MRRRDVFSALWREAFAVLPTRTRVIVAGAGPSGLHLALQFARHGLEVVVHDPAGCGGVRIPLLHACNLRKRGSALWQAASAYARDWYAAACFGPAVERHKGPFGEYISIHARTYLRLLRRQAQALGVQFVRTSLPADAHGPLFLAKGAATLYDAPSWSGSLAPLAGWQSYFALRAASEPVAEELARRDLRTNYFTHRRRAGFIHVNGTEWAAARKFGSALHPDHRHALFHGTRLTTRDRLPIVGFSLPAEASDFRSLSAVFAQRGVSGPILRGRGIFFFTGMGYHAMTYSPFLAERVAEWLTGRTARDEILLGALTPARFLPR